jgi:hypothetical protein
VDEKFGFLLAASTDFGLPRLNACLEFTMEAWRRVAGLNIDPTSPIGYLPRQV